MATAELTYGDRNEVCVSVPYALAVELRDYLLSEGPASEGLLSYFRSIPRYEVDDNGEPIRFLNHYGCDRCGTSWSDRWSATCDDDCPSCGANCSPISSDDIEPE